MSLMGLQARHEEGWPIHLKGQDIISFHSEKLGHNVVNCAGFQIDYAQEL